ncbi:MAG TPA: phosphoenolpyruvate carboxykinase (ATP), partial [Candidatus Aquilonibacter sp.]|nr:phosphoenolpyruvate carboxykinase (ATP) [Candidatus Aquilonibacter sp.]
VGKRMSIAHTRAMVNAAIEGRIPKDFEKEPFFGLMVPTSVPDVPSDVLNPRNVWPDKNAYDEQARKLSQLFFDNFKRFEMHASDGVKAVAIKPKH